MKKIIVLALTVFFALPAKAVVYGNSNLDFMGYPEFDEFPPSEPYSRDRYSFDQYRDEVEEYVRKAQDYVEAGNNDIQRIKEAQEEAIEKANQAISDFNDWANGY